FFHDVGRQPRLVIIGADAIEKIDQVRSIDARLRRVNDDKHLSRKIAGLAIKDDARDFDLIQQTGILQTEKMQAGQAMLPIDDKKSRLRVVQISDGLKVAKRPEIQDFFGNQQYASRNGALCFSRLIAIHY